MTGSYPTTMKKALILACALSLSVASMSVAESLSISKIFSEPNAETQQMKISYGKVTLNCNVSKQPAITEKDIVKANLVTVEDQGEQVELVLNEAGKEKFKKLTSESVDRQIAIVYNGSLISAPMVRQEISGGNVMISGNFTKEEAQKMVESINKATSSSPDK